MDPGWQALGVVILVIVGLVAVLFAKDERREP